MWVILILFTRANSISDIDFSMVDNSLWNQGYVL